MTFMRSSKRPTSMKNSSSGSNALGRQYHLLTRDDQTTCVGATVTVRV
ncbi:MAG TPA: hypothetical protein VNJ04_02580 [Gemmatimonadaceae bacterium]|nr:hypothetical protein [Gemmatimonadaceae bacterium]